jgi:hypothetical protein
MGQVSWRTDDIDGLTPQIQNNFRFRQIEIQTPVLKSFLPEVLRELPERTELDRKL